MDTCCPTERHLETTSAAMGLRPAQCMQEQRTTSHSRSDSTPSFSLACPASRCNRETGPGDSSASWTSSTTHGEKRMAGQSSSRLRPARGSVSVPTYLAMRALPASRHGSRSHRESSTIRHTLKPQVTSGICAPFSSQCPTCVLRGDCSRRALWADCGRVG